MRNRILKNHWEKMDVSVNVRMPKTMRTSIKIGVRTYATYIGKFLNPAFLFGLRISALFTGL